MGDQEKTGTVMVGFRVSPGERAKMKAEAREGGYINLSDMLRSAYRLLRDKDSERKVHDEQPLQAHSPSGS